MSHGREARQRANAGPQTVAIDVMATGSPALPQSNGGVPDRPRSRRRHLATIAVIVFLVGFALLNYALASFTAAGNTDHEDTAAAPPHRKPRRRAKANMSALLERTFAHDRHPPATDHGKRKEKATPERGNRPAAEGIARLQRAENGTRDAAPAEDKPRRRHRDPAIPADVTGVADVAEPPKAKPGVPHLAAHGHRRPHEGGVEQRTEHAFASVISNEKYVDGAIVLALSLFAKSNLLKQKTCELVLLGPKDLLPDSRARLQAAGYSQIKSLNDTLAGMIPDSTWKGTFDKLYLWSFVEYKLLAYFDADMLQLEDPDTVFEFSPPNSSWIGAHGSRSGSYFQTGMMVIRPDMAVFNSVISFFKRGVDDGTFEGANARDGQVARAFFGSRYIRIAAPYSMYRNASESIHGVKGFHFRGKFKPWFNMHKPPKFKPNHANGAVEFGAPYRLWWEYYESFHKNYTDAGHETAEGYGGQFTAPNVGPETHVWVMRHTEDEYVQPLWSVVLKQRNVVYETMTALVGHRGDSCETVCSKKSMECNIEGHSFTPINSCAFIAHAMKKDCKKCDVDMSDHHTPSYDPKSGHCYTNYLHDKLLMPTCDASSSSLKRVCVCTPPGRKPRKVPFHAFSQIPLKVAGA